MTDPNSSLLAQFDPIHNSDISETTPTRFATGSTLTMSTFFDRINTQQPLAPSIGAPNNRGSLIDVSFKFEEIKAAALDQLTPSQHRQHESFGVAHEHGGVENKVPQKLPRSSPRKQRDACAPTSPTRNPLHLDSPSRSTHGRRSSLDLSTLTLDIKHRLAAENMSFDILRDEVSFLTNTAEEEHSSATVVVMHSEPKTIAAVPA